MLWRDDHVCGAKKRVASSCVDAQFFVGCLSVLVGHGKVNFGADGLSDPVSLHDLYAFGPVKLVKVLQEALGVFGDFQNPLADCLSRDFRVAAFAAAFLDLFVGQAGLARRAPVDRSVAFVGEAFFVKLKENPLRPLVVVRVAGLHAAVPVVAKAERLYLLGKMFDV